MTRHAAVTAALLLAGELLAGRVAAVDLIGVTVSRFVDGDTAWFTIDAQEHKVRFAGVDTPELAGHCPGEAAGALAASRYTRAALTGARQIELRDYRPRRGGWRRDLAAVWVDGRDLGAELIGAGLGWPMKRSRADWCPLPPAAPDPQDEKN